VGGQAGGVPKRRAQGQALRGEGGGKGWGAAGPGHTESEEEVLEWYRFLMERCRKPSARALMKYSVLLQPAGGQRGAETRRVCLLTR